MGGGGGGGGGGYINKFCLRMDFFEMNCLLFGNSKVCCFNYLVTTKGYYSIETLWLQLSAFTV